jgi:hypothetical protein
MTFERSMRFGVVQWIREGSRETVTSRNFFKNVEYFSVRGIKVRYGRLQLEPSMFSMSRIIRNLGKKSTNINKSWSRTLADVGQGRATLYPTPYGSFLTIHLLAV